MVHGFGLYFLLVCLCIVVVHVFEANDLILLIDVVHLIAIYVSILEPYLLPISEPDLLPTLLCIGFPG